jgi:exopolysaccharide biosynthesis polyprenyl glycosylphosphotransferase
MKTARHKAELTISFLQVAADAAAIVAAFLFSYWLRFHSPLTGLVPVTKGFPGFQAYALSSLVVFLVWAFVFKSLGMYGANRNVGSADELMLVLKGVSFGMLIVTAAAFFYRGFSYSRMVFVLIWAAAILFLSFERILLLKIETRLHRRGKHLLKGLMAGASPWSVTLLDSLARHPGFGIDIVGYAGANPLLYKNLTCLGSLGQIREFVEKYKIDMVFIALPDAGDTLLEDCMEACAGLNIEFYMIPNSLELMSSRIRIQEIGGVPVLKIKEAAIQGWNAVFKRAFDLVFSVLAWVLILPILGGIAILIKLGSRGTIFYKQRRIGLDGREFDCLKFRTMYMDAEAKTGPVWTQANDPRVTAIGRLLRRFSLDELPQLVNVVRGEMSLVGPRPERPHFVEQFKKSIPKYLERHRVRSGMTGWAQVNGLRGNVSIDERTKYDVYYVENWSLLFDIKIILKTIWSVIKGENSY